MHRYGHGFSSPALLVEYKFVYKFVMSVSLK